MSIPTQLDIERDQVARALTHHNSHVRRPLGEGWVVTLLLGEKLSRAELHFRSHHGKYHDIRWYTFNPKEIESLKTAVLRGALRDWLFDWEHDEHDRIPFPEPNHRGTWATSPWTKKSKILVSAQSEGSGEQMERASK